MQSNTKRSGRFVMTIPPLALLAALPFMAGWSAPDVPAAAEQCTATLEPDSVLVQEGPVTVNYSFSEPMDSVGAVEAGQGSGITVVAIDAAASTVQLNTASATEGAWDLTFRGAADATCLGTITVTKEGASR